MSLINEEWIQSLAGRIRIPALSPIVIKTLTPAIELHAKQISIQAAKFQRRLKSRKLTSFEVNEALQLNKKEVLYGVSSVTSESANLGLGMVTTGDAASLESGGFYNGKASNFFN